MTKRGGQEPLVKIASAANQALAEMWKELLQNNGIRSLARISGPLTAYASFTSPHDLLVLAPDADQARQILAAFNENARDFAPVGDGEPGAEEGEDDYWMEGAEEEPQG